MAKCMILRIQSPEHGMTRISIQPTEHTKTLYDKVKETWKLQDDAWALFSDRKCGSEIRKSRSRSLQKDYRLNHGDVLYMKPMNGVGTASPSIPTIPSSTSFSVQEDQVDIELDKQDGKIQRGRDERMCRHGPSGKCLHCVPLEPFDEGYLKSQDPPIKFLSFHSYIRKLRSGVDKGKFVNLENLSCKIKPNCTEHAPWPAGICTKCQPNAVTLNRQKYRHIDYVTFENAEIMDSFLNFWRNSGCQRLGFLFGTYEAHPSIPLGIRAIVTAIYEPPQNSSKNSVELLDDPHDELVDQLAAELGMQRVGWILTDLVAADLSKGTVLHSRGSLDSYFLSAEECIMAAEFQNRYPNKCRWSSDGEFGSKFVTVIVTGDKDNQIHFEGYQVSDQCMGLVRDNCLIPTYDAPELGYIKESTSEQYVPDVFYKDKDKYGNEITHLARPLPVEYLLTDMSVAFPIEPKFTFTQPSSRSVSFPTENRSQIGEIQDFSALARYMHQFRSDDVLNALSDLHILLYLCHCEVFPLKEHLADLLIAVHTGDTSKAIQWSDGEQWSTMTQLLQAASAPTPTMAGRSNSFVGANAAALPPIGSTWQCAHCTFINTNNANTCDMCSLPKT